MEGDAVVSMRVNNFAGVMSKADAFGRKETAGKEGGSFGALLVGGCGARAVSRKTPIYFISTSRDHWITLFVTFILLAEWKWIKDQIHVENYILPDPVGWAKQKLNA